MPPRSICFVPARRISILIVIRSTSSLLRLPAAVSNRRQSHSRRKRDSSCGESSFDRGQSVSSISTVLAEQCLTHWASDDQSSNDAKPVRVLEEGRRSRVVRNREDSKFVAISKKDKILSTVSLSFGTSRDNCARSGALITVLSALRYFDTDDGRQSELKSKDWTQELPAVTNGVCTRSSGSVLFTSSKKTKRIFPKYETSAAQEEESR